MGEFKLVSITIETSFLFALYPTINFGKKQEAPTVAMIVVLAILIFVFARITYNDVTMRLVYRRDLIVLVVFRLVLFVVAVVGVEVFGVASFGVTSLGADSSGLNTTTDVSFGAASLVIDRLTNISLEQWGIRALVMSVAMALIVTAFVQLVAYITNRLTNKYGKKDESLGLGDVKLYAVCCLFLSFEQAFAMLFLSAVIGVFMAVYVKAIKKQGTFPFAPAIVWATFIVLVLDILA